MTEFMEQILSEENPAAKGKLIEKVAARDLSSTEINELYQTVTLVIMDYILKKMFKFKVFNFFGFLKFLVFLNSLKANSRGVMRSSNERSDRFFRDRSPFWRTPRHPRIRPH